MAGVRAVFPEARVLEPVGGNRLVHEPFEQRRQRRVLPYDARVAEDGLEAQHDLAGDVMLRLEVRGVADAHRTHAVVPAQVRHDPFVEVRSPVMPYTGCSGPASAMSRRNRTNASPSAR